MVRQSTMAARRKELRYALPILTGAVLALGAGCTPSEHPPAGQSATPKSARSAPTTASPATPSALAAPNLAAGDTAAANTGPRLILRNPTSTALRPYAAYLVDDAGLRETVQLWPHHHDCVDDRTRSKPPAIAAAGGTWPLPLLDGGVLQGFPFGKCSPGSPPPPGDYLLRVDSGYGDHLYAFRRLTLPLTESQTFDFVNRHETAIECTPPKAQRAARIAMLAARGAESFRAEWLAGCEPERARCSKDVQPLWPPPKKCSIRLHEGFLSIDRAATRDSIRRITSWLDREAVYARDPDVDATSASRVAVPGGPLFVAGQTSRHRHEHGGKAATVSGVSIAVFNPTPRDVPVSVTGISFLQSFSCELPAELDKALVATSVSSKSLPPGKSELRVSFAGQPVYQSHCNRWASRIALEIGGVTTAVTAEHQVMRFEPMRREP